MAQILMVWGLGFCNLWGEKKNFYSFMLNDIVSPLGLVMRELRLLRLEHPNKV